MAEKKCAHPACTCEAEAGSRYCSNSCELSTSSIECECGHAGCEGAAGVEGEELA